MLFCLNVQKCNAWLGSAHQNAGRKVEGWWGFAHAVRVCTHVHTCACISDTWAVGLLEADSLSVGSKNVFTNDDPLDLFLQVSFAFFLLFAFPSPIRHVNGSYHFPFSSAKGKKKKISLGFPSDFSLSLDEVPAIYIFVCSEGGGKHINKAQANPTALLDWKGLPGLMAAGLPNW